MGLFKCGNEDHPLDTDSVEEMRQHMADSAHTYVGNGECEQCGKKLKLEFSTKVKVTRVAPLVLCEDCKV